MSNRRHRHQDLWLEDGNVVLCSEGILFKVHRSILSRLSPFFLSHLSSWNTFELFEGYPLMQLEVGVADSTDLEALLWHLYHHKSVVRRISI
jgi:BTB/POZ domain